MALLKIFEDQRRNQIARDDEEDIDADIASREADAGMEEDDRQNGDRSQTVDFRPVAEVLDQG